MTCYNFNMAKNQVMSALFCLFLFFRSYPEKLEVYIAMFYKIRYILQELYVTIMWIIGRLIIYIDQLNTAYHSATGTDNCYNSDSNAHSTSLGL